MNILSPKETAEELAKIQVATAPEEPSEPFAIPADAEDLDRDLEEEVEETNLEEDEEDKNE